SLVEDMLPPGLMQHTFDITIQAPGGATFTTPAQLTMPNVFGLGPGEKTFILSFDHTTGRLIIDGTATASADGLTVSTDPGSGVTMPGWHGMTPPGTPSKGNGDNTPDPFDPKDSDSYRRLIRLSNPESLPQEVKDELDLAGAEGQGIKDGRGN